jgi:hypothetical protein
MDIKKPAPQPPPWGRGVVLTAADYFEGQPARVLNCSHVEECRAPALRGHIFSTVPIPRVHPANQPV